MKNQALFSAEVKSKKSKCRLLHFFGALRVKISKFSNATFRSVVNEQLYIST